MISFTSTHSQMRTRFVIRFHRLPMLSAPHLRGGGVVPLGTRRAADHFRRLTWSRRVPPEPIRCWRDYAWIARRSAAVAAVVGAAMIGLGAGLGGSKGLIGAVIGVALVAVFFGISIIAVGRAARVSPQVMMVTALGTYLVKIVVLLFLVGQFQDSTAFNPEDLRPDRDRLHPGLQRGAGHVVHAAEDAVRPAGPGTVTRGATPRTWTAYRGPRARLRRQAPAAAGGVPAAPTTARRTRRASAGGRRARAPAGRSPAT